MSFAADRIDLVHIGRRRDREPEVLFLRSRSRSPDDLSVLRELRKECDLAGYRCNTLLGRGEYQILQVDPPDVPPAEMKDALRWRLKDLISGPVEQTTVDMVEIPGDGIGRTKQVFAVAADNAVLAERVALFDGARLTLGAIDIPELAQRNVSALFEEHDRGLALLACDESGGMLTFTYRGELYAVRHTDIPLPQLEKAEGERREQLLERIALEAQRSLDNFERLYGHITVPRLLMSPLPSVPGFLEHMRQNISLPVEELDLGKVLAFPSYLELQKPERQAQLLKALGAALRD